MSLAEKFPRGFPENLSEGRLVFVREERYEDVFKETTSEKLMTALYNLLFYSPTERQLHFKKDQEKGVVHIAYIEEEEFGGIIGNVLKTAYVYFSSRRNLDGTLREKHRPVIGMLVEFQSPIPETDVWRTTVYRSPISRAAIYVPPELKLQAKEAFKKIGKLRRGEPVILD